jgi:RNA polymerase-binding transcription factor DksA
VSDQEPGAGLTAAGHATAREQLVTPRPDQAARDRLIAARADAVKLIAALARDHAGIVEAATSTATDDEHDPEGPTIAFERERTAALLRQVRNTLADLDRAAARLSDGSYGICEACHQPIGAARLAARPAASTCVTCAARRRPS